MTKQEHWHDFCNSQIERLGGAFPDFRFYKQPAIDELVAWLEDKAQGNKQNAMVFITEVTQFSDLPRIAELNNLWRQMYPAPDDVRKGCERCDGVGWIQVDGPFGLGAAYPCHHGPVTDADRRMGLKIPPAMQARYMREQREASPRAEVWQGTGGKVDRDEMKRVNLATIGRILDGV